MTLTLTVKEVPDPRWVKRIHPNLETLGMPDATEMERSFADALVLVLNQAIPEIHARLGGTHARMVERDLPTTATTTPSTHVKV